MASDSPTSASWPPEGVRNQARSCPIDLDKLGWVDGANKTVAESGEYLARICHIDGLLFAVKNEGYLCTEDALGEVGRLEELLDAVTNYHPEARAIFVLDAEGFTGMSVTARRTMIDMQRRQPAYGGTTMYNAPMVLRLFSRASAFFAPSIRLCVVPDFAQALAIAREWATRDEEERTGSSPIAEPSPSYRWFDLSPERLGLTPDDLEYESPDKMLRVTMRHIDGPIYEQFRDTRTARSKETGESAFMARHLEAVSRVDDAARLFMLVQISGHTGMSLASRRSHLELLKKYPVLGAVAIVGANTTVGRPLAWFIFRATGIRYRFCDERAPALAWLQECAGSKMLPVMDRAGEPGHADEQLATSELLLERIARITLDPTHDSPPLNLAPDDPLSLVAGAVDVLREDVVEMLAQRECDLEELASRDRILRETLADLAHDVRTPLTSLKLGLDGLRSGRDPEAIGQVLRAEVEHLEIMFHNLSTLMQLGASSYALSPQPTDMTEQCERICQRFDVLAKDSGVTFELGLPEEPLWLRVDSLAVVQAVGNVVHNAIKYARGVVAVVLGCRDGNIEIRIEDDGQGMAGLDVNALLKRYTRGRRGLDEARSGSGLGLAIANAIMVEHGGDIVVGESASGGARVRLRFPETLRVSSPSSALATAAAATS